MRAGDFHPPPSPSQSHGSTCQPISEFWRIHVRTIYTLPYTLRFFASILHKTIRVKSTAKPHVCSVIERWCQESLSNQSCYDKENPANFSRTTAHCTYVIRHLRVRLPLFARAKMTRSARCAKTTRDEGRQRSNTSKQMMRGRHYEYSVFNADR